MKRKVETVQTPVLIRLYPLRPAPNPQVLAGSHNIPPLLSGSPPDPVPPLRLQIITWGFDLLRRRSWGRRFIPSPGAPERAGWWHGVGRLGSRSRRRAKDRVRR